MECLKNKFSSQGLIFCGKFGRVGKVSHLKVQTVHLEKSIEEKSESENRYGKFDLLKS
jgi:hypothetical protein